MVLLKLDESAKDDAAVKVFLESFVWPTWHWCRMILVLLSEVNFEIVPEAAEQHIRGFLRSFHITIWVERVFNALRAAEKKALDGNLSPLALWHRAHVSGLVKESGRTQTEPNQASSNMAPRTLPSKVFVPNTAPAQFPDDKMEDLSLNKLSWPSPAPQTFWASIFSWLRAYQLDGDVDAIMDSTWINLLAEQSVLLRHPEHSPEAPHTLF